MLHGYHRTIAQPSPLLRALLVLEPYEVLTLLSIVVYVALLIIARRLPEWSMLFGIVEITFSFFAFCLAVALSMRIMNRIRRQGTTGSLWYVPSARFYVRIFGTFLLSFFVYHNLNALTSIIHFEDKDAALRAIDQWLLFGHDPTLLLQRIVSPPLTEYFRFVYSMHIFLFFATPMLLALQNRRAEFNNVVFSLTLTLCIGFIGYMLVPAVGPYLYPPLRDAYTVSLDGSTLANAQAQFIDAYSYPRSVFPSLHTAVCSVILVYVWRYNRNLVWFFLPLAISIWCSTLYLRYHYLIDIFAGWLLAWLVCSIAPIINQRWETWRAQMASHMA